MLGLDAGIALPRVTAFRPGQLAVTRHTPNQAAALLLRAECRLEATRATLQRVRRLEQGNVRAVTLRGWTDR